jgi:methionyl-tRNA formyltransferase
LIVVCAYGKILPKETLGVPRLGCVNIHASLLPKYRGAAPVHRAVEAGEIESGVTLIYMSEGMDEGDIIASRSISIKGMTSGEATGSLAQLGAELLSDELSTIIGGTARRVPQDDAEATYAPPVLREEGSIDFSGAPDGIVRKILAMTPSPGAYAFLGVEKIKVIGACASLDTFGNKAPRPGEVVSVSGGVIRIASGKGGSVEITRLQSPGGKPMSSAEWLRGHALEPGALFE